MQGISEQGRILAHNPLHGREVTFLGCQVTGGCSLLQTVTQPIQLQSPYLGGGGEEGRFTLHNPLQRIGAASSCCLVGDRGADLSIQSPSHQHLFHTLTVLMAVRREGSRSTIH